MFTLSTGLRCMMNGESSFQTHGGLTSPPPFVVENKIASHSHQYKKANGIAKIFATLSHTDHS